MRSWLWAILTQMVMDMQDQAFIQWFGQLEKNSYHSYMHGDARKKDTRLLSPLGLFGSLAVEYDGITFTNHGIFIEKEHATRGGISNTFLHSNV